MFLSRPLNYIFFMMLLVAVNAGAADDTAAPSGGETASDAPAATPSLFDRAKSALSKLKPAADEEADKGSARDGLQREKSEKGRNAAEEGERDGEGKAKGKEKSFFGSVKGAFGFGGEEKSVSKLKDIQEVSLISAKQFDPACTSIVEPFGVTDNLGSLAMLGAKLAIGNMVISINGGSQLNVKSTLRLAGKNLNWLPMQAERMLGQSQHDAMAGSLLDINKKSDREVVERANAIMQKILLQVKEETPYKFDLSVQRKGGMNAQALPGGFIHVEKDLVADKKKDALAYFAMAHEIAHVLQRHETRSVQARVTDSIDSLDGLRKIIEGATSNPGSLLAYSNELMTRFVVFSKSQELQADACAVRLLDSAFPDKKRLAEVIRTYTKALPPPEPASAAGNQLEVFVENIGKMDKLHDQHPNSSERIANLEKMLAEVSTPKKPSTADAKVALPPVATGR